MRSAFLVLIGLECQKVFFHMIPTDCFALCAHALLKTFEIRPIRATFSYFAGPKLMLFHASMNSMTFCPWYLNSKTLSK